MADVFDATTKKNRGSYEGWDKDRRDPRLKSTHLNEANENNSTGVHGGQKWGTRQEFPQDIYSVPSNNPLPISQGDNQDLWKQTHNFQQQNPYGAPPMQTMYNDPRQQYSTMYPQQGQYPQYSSGRMQPDYSQNQYQSFYSVAENSYVPQTAPPAWRNTSHSDGFQDPNHPNMQSSTAAQLASQMNETKNDGNKKAAVAEEMKHQRATIRKQREECIQKSAMLKRELELLKKQKQELLAEFDSGSIPRETQRILRKNTKLQTEIQEKIKAMSAVIEMLSGITTEDSGRDKSSDRQPDSSDRQKSPKEMSRSPSNSTTFNMVHYDPELHWCRVCDVFPTSAKDFLNHLHTDKHRETSQHHQIVEMPWHNTSSEPEVPTIPGAPTKRTPIKGLEFFISAPAWYCKLCDKWIGDLHCASLHLKSKVHIQNYNNFIEQNPFWESNWLSDRKKAFTRAQKKSLHNIIDASTLNESSPPGDYSPSLKGGKRKKNNKDKRDSSTSSRDKKKKKKSKKRKKALSSDSSSSSSSSSFSSDDEMNESDKSKSIRVAMRNKMKMQAQKMLSEEYGEKLNVLSKLVDDKNQRKSTFNQDILGGISSKLDSDAKTSEEPSNDLINFQYLRNRFRPSHLRTQESSFKDDSTSETRRSLSKERESERRRYSRRSRSRSPVRKRSYDRYDSPGAKKYRDKYSPKKYNDRYSPFDKKKKFDRYDNDYKNKNSNDKYYREKEENDKHRDDKNMKKNKENEQKIEADQNKQEKEASDTVTANKPKSPTTAPTQKKMPFIGRMPLFKKKIEDDKKNESEKTKFAVNLEARKMLPAPGLVHISHLSAPMYPFNADNPPPPPQIIPDPPQIIPEPPQISGYMCAPPPPVLSHLMDGQSVPVSSDGDKPKGEISAESQEAALLMAQFHMMNETKAAASYSYPGYDPQLLQSYVLAAQMPPLPPEEEADEERKDVSNADDAEISGNDKDDLALLGIDAEDLAAQNL